MAYTVNTSTCNVLLQPFLSDLGQLLKGSSDEELCVEALGILANLNLPDIDFQRVVTQLDLLPYVISKLKVSVCTLYVCYRSYILSMASYRRVLVVCSKSIYVSWLITLRYRVQILV